jgi:hypothetical protein
MRIDEYPALVKPAILSVVGELAEDADFLLLERPVTLSAIT